MAINKIAIQQKVKDCLAKGNAQFNAEASIAKIVYTDDEAYAGKAVSDKGIVYIILSTYFLEIAFDWIISEIIPHEVAHVIGFWLTDNKMKGSYAHGPRWREIAKYLGASGAIQPKLPADSEDNVKYQYKSSTGRSLYLNKDQHEDLQHNFKVFKDNNDGGRVTAGGFVGRKKAR